MIANRDSSIAGGALTDTKGNFLVEGIADGKIQITYYNFGIWNSFLQDPFLVIPFKSESDAGVISIDPTAASLKQVDISASVRI